MKLVKIIVNKLGCNETPSYFLGKKGNDFNIIPKRDFFRDNFENMDVMFDYHVNFEDELKKEDFILNIILKLNNETLLNLDIIIKFSSEMSGKLIAKYKFELPTNFNYMIGNV